MSVARVTEISATSPDGFEQAVIAGVNRANQTLRHVQGAWVKEQEVRIDEGKIVDYKVIMKITFLLDES